MGGDPVPKGHRGGPVGQDKTICPLAQAEDVISEGSLGDRRTFRIEDYL